MHAQSNNMKKSETNIKQQKSYFTEDYLRPYPGLKSFMLASTP